MREIRGDSEKVITGRSFQVGVNGRSEQGVEAEGGGKHSRAGQQVFKVLLREPVSLEIKEQGGV